MLLLLTVEIKEVERSMISDRTKENLDMRRKINNWWDRRLWEKLK